MPDIEEFHFEISLSVLNHLGRNLYRNFITVIGEAISNSWDSDAKNVWIDIASNKSSFSIRDDGSGMTPDDFQNKFLKIGYSKRKDGATQTDSDRPYIGSKGIGKLALLSCADKVSIRTKTLETDYVGGLIDNADLDVAIKDDLNPDQYTLEKLDFLSIDGSTDFPKGTLIRFLNPKERIRNSIPHLKKLIAMNFRFSVIDSDFTIYVNDDPVTVDDLKDLSKNTQFVWVVDGYSDDFTETFKESEAEEIPLTTDLNIRGFFATTKKPSHLKIYGIDERVTLDLFVNGRLREKNILRHIPTQRITESYLYGQIHFDSMDRLGNDPFTSSREGIVEDDENFQDLLKYLKEKAIPKILDDWDKLRLESGDDGDDENTKRASKKLRSAKSLYQEAKREFELNEGSPNKDIVDQWLKELAPDAGFNSIAYTDCYLSENLVRKYISSKDIRLDDKTKEDVEQYKKQEVTAKRKANISFDIRQDPRDESYLDMGSLASAAEDSKDIGRAPLLRDAISYKPIRNAVGHTGLLTDEAKFHLNMTFKNIKARVKKMMSN